MPDPPKIPSPQGTSGGRPDNRPDARIIEASLHKVEFSSGPIPHPELLRGYEQICPGGADRIIRMAETEGDHRRRMEEKALDAQVESMRRGYLEARLGQVFAFAIATVFLVGGSYVAIEGQPWAGSIFGSVGLAGIVSAFIWGRTKNTEERPAEKQPAPQPPRKKRR